MIFLLSDQAFNLTVMNINNSKEQESVFRTFILAGHHDLCVIVPSQGYGMLLLALKI